MSFFMKHKAKVQLMLLAAAAIFTAYGALRGRGGYSAGQGNTDMSGVCWHWLSRKEKRVFPCFYPVSGAFYRPERRCSQTLICQTSSKGRYIRARGNTCACRGSTATLPGGRWRMPDRVVSGGSGLLEVQVFLLCRRYADIPRPTVGQAYMRLPVPLRVVSGSYQ